MSNFIQIGQLRQSYEVIAIFRMAAVRQPCWIYFKVTHEVQLMLTVLSLNFGLIGFVVSDVVQFLHFGVVA